MTGKLVFYSLVFIFIGSTLSLVLRVNNYFLAEVPTPGGQITEGVLGVPRHLNPILAVTDSDKDISALVYSGLMRESADGSLIPDLAESYTVSPDGKTYTFILKPKLVFQDSQPVTADDVLYTISQIQNPGIKSPRYTNWNGIMVEKVDDRTIKFTLSEAYAPFLENTTIGILPKHLWFGARGEAFPLNEHNEKPIGTGPYTVKSVRKSGDGVPTSYTLEANKNFGLGKPMIQTITFKFYPNEKALADAYTSGEVDNINGISPSVASDLAKHGATIHTASLPRVFGVFFNQTANPALSAFNVRQALDIAVNRDYIVNIVLENFGTSLHGPTPQSISGNSSSNPVEEANALLDKAGWTKNPEGIRERKGKIGTTTLAFSISTSDVPELKQVAEVLKSEWKAIGADVSVKVFEGGYLNQNIIRPRKYDALLFGQIVNSDSDLYAFWHSSQAADPGLNIALYDNEKADKILENLRAISDNSTKEQEFAKLATLINTDIPAVFLYSPDLLYATSKSIHNININNVSVPSERFNSVYSWYIRTERVWKIFL